MPSNDIFSTYATSRQAEIIAKLMELFKGNERFHGAGELKGAFKNEDKNKWMPGNIRAIHKKLIEDDWRAHLSGERFIGISPLLDDGTVWFTCMDIDKIGDNPAYEFEYADEMGKIKRSGFPLVVYRTKSGGLRVVIFFSEPVEADLAVRRMQQMSAQLGYAPCEIFPKQVKVNDTTKDHPAWIFLPHGPAKDDMFPDQCCMNESGHAMELYESVIHAMRKRVKKQEFFDLFVVEMNHRANGKANGKTRPKGLWTEEKDYETTWCTTFTDGPICLWHIAQWKCREFQHNFLLNCASFFMRKYPDNWEVALKWVNRHVLVPEGNDEKFRELVNSIKKSGKERYEYTCKNEPICSHCFAKACKKQPYGVGEGNGVDYYDLAITVWNSKPQLFFVNVGDDRIACSAAELLNLKAYRQKCLENSLSFPDNKPQREWDKIIKNSLENATIVDPPELMRSNASEISILQKYFGMHIPRSVRAWGNEFLAGKGKPDDLVRVREKEHRVYFKFDGLETFCRRSFFMGKRELQDFRMYVTDHGEWHDRKESRGRWYRSTFSLDMKLFDEDIVKHWLAGGEWEDEDDE